MINTNFVGLFIVKNQDNRWQTSPSFWEKLKPKAREMRLMPTKAENILWRYLRDGKLKKFRFRRQHSLGQFIVDFYCKKANLVIEVDGLIHMHQIEKDTSRQEYLENQGYKVLRFSNEVIIESIGKVIEKITSSLTDS
jgi:5-methyltetrahydrofolate--homocysteine methyltransferase